MAATVLIVTNPTDEHVDHAIVELKARGKSVVRLHPEDLAQGLFFSDIPTAERGSFSYYHHSVAFDDVVSFWYRKPRPIKQATNLSTAEAEFSQKELAHGFYGLLRCLRCLWVSHPSRMAEASWKPRQLRLAAGLGLEIPRTIITNRAEDVIEFWNSSTGAIIYKTLESPLIGGTAACYTSVVTAEHIQNASMIPVTGGIFQERVEKACDLRIIAIGSKIFAFEIYVDKNHDCVDWRFNDPKNLTHKVHNLDANIKDILLRYLEECDLKYGAFDFVFTPDGRYVFLECNPGGQYGWLESATGVPLTKAIVDLLTLEAA